MHQHPLDGDERQESLPEPGTGGAEGRCQRQHSGLPGPDNDVSVARRMAGWAAKQRQSDDHVHNQQPAPVVQFSANPQTIHTGDSSTLSWNVQNSQQVYLDGNPVGAQGSKQVSPNQETIYTLRVIGLDGSDTSYQVTVSVIIAINTPTIDIQANPTDIDQGQCSTLSWNASHGSEFYINGDSVGQSGSKQVCPNQTTDYTFRVVTLGTMDAYRTARVNVHAVAEPTPEPMPMPTVAPPEPQPEPPQPETTPTEMIIGPAVCHRRSP